MTRRSTSIQSSTTERLFRGSWSSRYGGCWRLEPFGWSSVVPSSWGDQCPFVRGPVRWLPSSQPRWRGPVTPAAPRRCGYVITSMVSGTTGTSLFGTRAMAAPDSRRPSWPRSVSCSFCSISPTGRRPKPCRIDFTYAHALDLDDPGFHHSVLTDFRDRLCEDDRADQLLLLSLTRMREAGMVPGRGRQRTDSTRVPAAARDLTRLELVLEAVRAALEEAAQRAPDILDGLVDAEWATRHGRPVRLPSQPSHPVTRLKQAGADARRLLDRLPYHGRGLARKRCDRSSCRTSSSTPVADYVLAPRRTDSPPARHPAHPHTRTPHTPVRKSCKRA